MSGTRKFGWVGILGLLTATVALPQGRPISGYAPVGASGRAPVGAAGRAPTGGVSSIATGVNPSTGFHGPRPPGVGGGHNPGGPGYRDGRNHGGRYGSPVFLWGGPVYGGPLLSPDDAAEAGPEPVLAPPPPMGDPLQSVAAQQEVLTDEIQRLNAKLDRMQSGQAEAPPEQAQAKPVPAAPPVTLVLRNGGKVQSSSFAVMNGVFWDFSKQPARRVPVSDVDLTASARATEESGAEFPEF
jgi:hypothetical protein